MSVWLPPNGSIIEETKSNLDVHLSSGAKNEHPESNVVESCLGRDDAPVGGKGTVCGTFVDKTIGSTPLKAETSAEANIPVNTAVVNEPVGKKLTVSLDKLISRQSESRMEEDLLVVDEQHHHQISSVETHDSTMWVEEEASHNPPSDSGRMAIIEDGLMTSEDSISAKDLRRILDLPLSAIAADSEFMKGRVASSSSSSVGNMDGGSYSNNKEGPYFGRQYRHNGGGGYYSSSRYGRGGQQQHYSQQQHHHQQQQSHNYHQQSGGGPHHSVNLINQKVSMRSREQKKIRSGVVYPSTSSSTSYNNNTSYSSSSSRPMMSMSSHTHQYYGSGPTTRVYNGQHQQQHPQNMVLGECTPPPTSSSNPYSYHHHHHVDNHHLNRGDLVVVGDAGGGSSNLSPIAVPIYRRFMPPHLSHEDVAVLQTQIINNTDELIIRLKNTDIVKVNRTTGDIVLTSGGYKTVLTRAAMNAVLHPLSLQVEEEPSSRDWQVSDGKAYLEVFVDGMVLKSKGMSRFQPVARASVLQQYLTQRKKNAQVSKLMNRSSQKRRSS